jgi:biotin operon repressor
MMSLQEVAKTFPIGQPVRFYPVAGEPEFETAIVRSKPWQLGSGAIVVKITGRAGGVLTEPEFLRPGTGVNNARLVAGLAELGFSAREISEKLSLSISAVYRNVDRARAEGATVPAFRSNAGRGRRSVPFPKDLKAAFAPAAEEFGLSPVRLAERVLRRVAEDDLFKAILDDDGDRA